MDSSNIAPPKPAEYPSEPPPAYSSLGTAPALPVPANQIPAYQTPSYQPPPYQVQQNQPTTVIIAQGPIVQCPNCRAPNSMRMTDNVASIAFALICVIILAILFFPIGLLYFFCLPSSAKTYKCINCGYEVQP